MIAVESHPRAEEVRQHARHVLFVEGKGENALDPVILRRLLPDAVGVRALGSSHSVRSVAQALHRHHPEYYFLVDRDHHDDDFVKECWDKFPDPDTSNLLVWPRRELENYFIMAEYALKSAYLSAKEEKLRQAILACCQRQLFLDAANQVIVAIREEQKTTWVELFTKPGEFRTKDAALARLLERNEFAAREKFIAKQMGKEAIASLFEAKLDDLTDGKTILEFGRGRWLEFLKGKEILPTVVQECFKVVDNQGKSLQGRDKMMEVAKELVRKPLEEQPEDFRRLHQLIAGRVRA